MGLNSPSLETNKRYFLKIPRCLRQSILFEKLFASPLDHDQNCINENFKIHG